MKQITSRFAGTCKQCGNQFPAGTLILWPLVNGGAKHAGVCPPPAAAKPVALPIGVDLSKVVAFIDRAKAHLKFPKLRFLSSTNQEITLSVAGAQSNYPGTIQVKVAGEWIGRVDETGSATRRLAENADLVATLQVIALDPAAAAKKYAQLFGSCSFCGKELTDAGSVELGYGAICARHYGLPHTPKGSPAIRRAEDDLITLAAAAAQENGGFRIEEPFTGVVVQQPRRTTNIEF
jgi:hypothetical protein